MKIGDESAPKLEVKKDDDKDKDSKKKPMKQDEILKLLNKDQD